MNICCCCHHSYCLRHSSPRTILFTTHECEHLTHQRAAMLPAPSPCTSCSAWQERRPSAAKYPPRNHYICCYGRCFHRLLLASLLGVDLVVEHHCPKWKPSKHPVQTRTRPPARMRCRLRIPCRTAGRKYFRGAEPNHC